ncbi:MAG TPA: alpha/beta fold hydrolase [Candidatus Acidoferrales bacterium]|nr:alpha/beta fold hydrolase [Candidatus Acidoferrales bacterium]
MLIAVVAALAALLVAPVLIHVVYAASVRRRFPPRGVQVTAGDASLRVVTRGTGPAVLLVHGMNGTAQDFPDALLDDLARDHTVLALDRPGHGGSSRGRGALDLDANARAVLAVIAARGGGRAIVVGHSYGGAVALRSAELEPARVAGLVLLTPCTVVDDRNRRYTGLPLPPGFARRVALWAATLPVGLVTTRRTRREAWHPVAPRGDLTFSRAWALVPSQTEAALENFHTLAPDLAALAADLPRIAAPVVVLAGEQDLITPWRAHAAWLPGAIAGAALDVRPGAGHWLVRQQPEAVAAAVRGVRVADPARA